MTKGDEVLMRAAHLGLAIGDLQKAARSVVAERDVLGLPVAGRSTPHVCSTNWRRRSGP